MGVERRNILVIEDDLDIRESLEDLLTSEGYEVTLVEGGQAALSRLSAGLRPHLILLDLNMPGMNGREVLFKIKEDPETALIPVAYLTAAGDAQVESLENQAAGLIRKPFELDELLTVVSSLIS
jgi:CheY-like chemotaxis protein